MITRLEDFKAHTMAMEVAEEVWDVVIKWGYFEKDTVGRQLVKAVDSIAANLSEGLGRYHFKEARNFGYYSRGSLFESRTWLQKSLRRKLIKEEQLVALESKLQILGRMINAYINSIGGGAQEPDVPYPSNGDDT